MRFYLDAAKYLVDGVPYGVAKYRSDASAHARSTAPGAPLRRRRLRLPRADRQHAGAPPLPRHPVHTQRRSRNLAPARRERAAIAGAVPARAAVEADAAVRAGRPRRFDRRWRCRMPIGRPSSGCTRRPAKAGARIQTGVDTAYFVPSATPARRAHLVFTGSMDWLPNEDGDAVLRARDSSAHPPGGARRHAEHHRAGAHSAVRRLGGSRASRSPAGSTTSGRTSRRGRSTSCRCASAEARGSRSSRPCRWPRRSCRPRSAPRACR